MTLQQRAEAYAAAFPQFPSSHLRLVQEQGGDVLYGTWLGGQNYRQTSALYGAYPPKYLDRVLALFPDLVNTMPLHVFSGSLPPGHYMRVDVNAARHPDRVGSVYDIAQVVAPFMFRLVLADPPYSTEDATRYGTPMVDRRRAIAALADVTVPGGYLVWLDTVWPMHRKAEWRTVGRITLVRSTNHRVRLISIFARVSEAAGVPAAAAHGRRPSPRRSSHGCR